MKIEYLFPTRFGNLQATLRYNAGINEITLNGRVFINGFDINCSVQLNEFKNDKWMMKHASIKPDIRLLDKKIVFETLIPVLEDTASKFVTHEMKRFARKMEAIETLSNEIAEMMGKIQQKQIELKNLMLEGYK